MSLRINEGYIITDSIHIDEHEFVSISTARKAL